MEADKHQMAPVQLASWDEGDVRKSDFCNISILIFVEHSKVFQAEIFDIFMPIQLKK